MIDLNTLSRGDHYESQLHALRLELEKTRSQAEAARLEARAVELELEIARLNGELANPSGIITRFDGGHQRYFGERPAEEQTAAAAQALLSDAEGSFQSWGDVRGAISNRQDGVPRYELQDEPLSVKEHLPPGDGQAATAVTNESSERLKTKEQSLRVDSPHSVELLDSVSSTEKISPPKLTAGDAFAVEQDGDGEHPVRSRPAAWMISAIVHAAILFFLALFTLSNQKPGDALAIAGSVSETDEVAIETISIETQQMEISESEPVPSEMEYELSDVGELAITELALDAPPAPPSPLLESFVESSSSSQAMMSLKSDSKSTMKFCGVEGGGNHFVYLVDSSGSMGEAFESARSELLQSIDALQPDQRFYVIFFDAESDYMRLSSPDEDESRSVYATPQNKLALRSWAKTIQMDRGRAPYDALPFAIELRPDVIFLLSDGEFPQSIEDLLVKINRVDNLFGDNDPISIVHTISYHSREGESRMRRLAKQHGGQYRHVPKP